MRKTNPKYRLLFLIDQLGKTRFGFGNLLLHVAYRSRTKDGTLGHGEMLRLRTGTTEEREEGNTTNDHVVNAYCSKTLHGNAIPELNAGPETSRRLIVIQERRWREGQEELRTRSIKFKTLFISKRVTGAAAEQSRRRGRRTVVLGPELAIARIRHPSESQLWIDIISLWSFVVYESQ